jgi:aldose 1-epimerase
MIEKYILTNGTGASASILNYGATLYEMIVPDRDGVLENVTLSLPSYQNPDRENNSYLGCIVGRYANRMAHGRFSLDGEEYQLETNNGEHHLHGGVNGFDSKIWKVKEHIEGSDFSSITLTHVSPDGDSGYPGEVSVSVTYSLNKDNELTMDYEATTNKATPLCLTNHAYWNLDGSGLVLDHELKILADSYLPTDEGLIPTAEIKSVEGTVMDFRQQRKVSEDQKGYDDCYVLQDKGAELKLAAILHSAKTGRTMEVHTTEPALQLYTGCYLGADKHPSYGGLCLEAQKFPDSPNNSQFPSCILRPTAVYQQKTVHKFVVNSE